MCIKQQFEIWRETKGPKNSWGLAWFLANEFCQRYYSSHGIVPSVLLKEGLGYYGILIEGVRCRVKDSYADSLGRLTMEGNVENWRRGGPGDHGLKTVDWCLDGRSTDAIIREAITFMGIETVPAKSHLNCRHKRWGDSYKLCFEIATVLALRYEPEEIEIWNHSYHTKRLLSELDPKFEMKEHLGAFLFTHKNKKLLLAADGRLFDGSGEDLWQKYMCGSGVSYLAELIEDRIL